MISYCAFLPTESDYVPSHGSVNIHGTSVSSVAVHDNRNVDLPEHLLSLSSDLLECNVPSIGKSKGRCHGIPRQKYNWKSSFLTQPRAQGIVAAHVSDNLGRVIVRFLEHGADLGGIDGWDCATAIGELELDAVAIVADSGRFAGLKFEGVGVGIDDGFGHFDEMKDGTGYVCESVGVLGL